MTAVVGIEAVIMNALMSTLEAQNYSGINGLGKSTGNLKYAWPETSFDTAVNPYYLEVSLVLNNHGWQALNNANVERMGFLQVKVIWPKGEGVINPGQVASAIAAAWANAVVYGAGVKIDMTPAPYLGSPMSDQTRVTIPVNIPWKAYKTN